MKKMLKIIAMLLVIATVVFAAGCSDKTAESTEEGAEEAVDEETAPVAEDGEHAVEEGADVPPELGPDDNVTVAEDNETDLGDNVTVAEDNETDLGDNVTVAEDNETVEDNETDDTA
ncbi:hypothetical protein MSSAC_0725 [Methanosarcina siciliae C2J]|uniref:Uncharacterized protein n=2 Tax=Methanosarcina siciliae TaxID=38027 RepID=A0A0E3PCP8_9EURY|nr:hypothetical protein [Methanosarcina siciliae]AKB31359.1 hypothetical protein MSSIH_0669 [Methanosarcina siciliae HI350]AKB35315.1 hypothetical protein MSSAC_0725 [Methanosarcina siciliae C2J]